MKILHIAAIENKPCCGTSVVIPYHVVAQQKISDVGFINFRNGEFKDIKKQYLCRSVFDFYKNLKLFGKPDLVVFHEVYIWQYIIVSAYLRRFKIPYIIIPHGSLTCNAQKYKCIKKKIGNSFLFYKFINGAIALQFLSRIELKSSNFGKVKFIGTNGITLPQLTKLNFNKNSLVFCYIGRLNIYYKGIDLLILAISKKADVIREKKVDIKIYGPDEDNSRNKISNLIKKYNLSDIVSLNKEVFANEKEKVLLESDVFIQTSRTEGMPMGILEAMSYGLPCLVTRGTSLVELIEKYDAGWVCETNIESIIECIVKCCQEIDLFKTKGQNARRLIEENFTWEKIARETIENYEKINNLGSI